MAVGKSCALFEVHQELEAKIAPVHGWNLPMSYPGGAIAEHRHTRNSCGVFDTSHLGKFQIAGGNSTAVLDLLLARSVSDLPVGCCRYNLLLNEFGGVIDDLIISRMAENDYFVVVNCENIDIDSKCFQSKLSKDSTFRDLSSDLAKIDIAGPKAMEVLANLGVEISDLPSYYRWSTIQIGAMRAIISRTSYSGELGYELFFDVDFVYDLWEELINDVAVRPVGMIARDSLRLEMGYPRYGHELSVTLTPEESGLGRLSGLKPPLRPMERKQIGAISAQRGNLQPGNIILNHDGVTIGVVTSGGYSPTLDKTVLLGSVDVHSDIQIGNEIIVDNGKDQLSAIVATPVFIKSTSLHKQL